jgi:hypothetical protein
LNKIITLNDGIQVEVEINENEAFEISDTDFVDSSIDKIQLLLHKVCTPISATFNELEKSINVESTKVTIGVKVGVEGNFFIAKSTGEANIQVELTIGKNNE